MRCLRKALEKEGLRNVSGSGMSNGGREQSLGLGRILD